MLLHNTDSPLLRMPLFLLQSNDAPNFTMAQGSARASH